MTTKNQTTTMPKPAQSGTAAAGTGSVQTFTALTTTTTTKPTTTTTTTKPTAGRSSLASLPPIPYKIAKWSGEDEPSEYRRWGEDTDTIRLTVDEQRRLRCIYINARKEWHDSDTDK